MRIGIFDSGIGGLGVVTELINKTAPHASILYFADTAHFPYGDKSKSDVVSYSIKITDFLLQNGCDIIVIACVTASSVVTDVLKAYVPSGVKIINAIDPTVSHIKKKFSDCTIGLIGTQLTVKSMVFEKKIKALNQGIVVRSVATPQLAPIIEDTIIGETTSPYKAYIKSCLNIEFLDSIKALILGCTHYNFVSLDINEYYKCSIPVIDCGFQLALQVTDLLDDYNLITSNTSKKVELKFFASKFTPAFAEKANIICKNEYSIEEILI